MIQLSPGLFTLRADDMSSGISKYRHFHAISPRDLMLAGKPHRRRKKNYSLFLNDLAEAVAVSYSHGQAIACYPQMGYRLRAFAGKKNLSTKSHEITRSRTKRREGKKAVVSDLTLRSFERLRG
jgi:hypothetical protein